MTTPLTIYRFGLCGNSANESIGKHRFRTKKHQKANKSSQKTTQNRFGYWRPGVRISTLRPKRNRQPLRLSVPFLLVWMPKTSLLRSRKEFAYPSEDRQACLSDKGHGYLQKEYIHTSTKKKKESPYDSLSFLPDVGGGKAVGACPHQWD